MRRGKERWTQADDERLSNALLAVYETQGEAVVTSDVSDLWTRVEQRYQAFATAEKSVQDITAAPRSARSLHTRWARDIRPEMMLYASIVDRLQQAGWKPAQAGREASRRFQSKRSQVNAEIMRQFAQDSKRVGQAQAEPRHPRLKFESFHYRHCYDILRTEPRFLEALLTQKTAEDGENGDRKRRLGETGDEDDESRNLSSDDSDEASADEEDARVESTPELTPAPPIRPLQLKPSNTSREGPAVSYQGSSARSSRHGSPRGPGAERTDDGAFQWVPSPDRDQRLKLLAELRAVVSTIAKLTKQLRWNGVSSAALEARMGKRCPKLDEDVLRDIALFRQEKRRLKQELAALGSSGNAR